MNEQAIRFRIGIFVLGALILLAVLILLFGGFPTYFKSVGTYYIQLKEAPGVNSGTPVRRSGVRIGEVRKINLDDETGLVHLEIQVESKHTIRHHDQAILTRGLFGTEVAIELVSRKADGIKLDQTPLAPGETITGGPTNDPVAFLQKTSSLVAPAQDALDEFRKLMKHFDQMNPLVEQTLTEYRELAKSMRETVPEMRNTGQEIKEMAKAAKEIMPDVRKTAENLQDLSKSAREMVPQFNKTMEEVHSLVKDSRQLVPEARKTLEEIQITSRIWSKVGERTDILLANNEEKLVKTLDRLQETLRRAGEFLSEGNQKNVETMLKNVRAASERFESMTKSADEILQDARPTMKKINQALERTDDVLANLQKISKPLADRSQGIVTNLDETTSKLNLLLGDMRDLLREFNKNEGTLQKILNDPSLYNNLNQAACTINRLLPRIDFILRDVEIFADKIARHPEALGIGGAIRPSNGLKDAPTILPYRGTIIP